MSACRRHYPRVRRLIRSDCSIVVGLPTLRLGRLLHYIFRACSVHRVTAYRLAGRLMRPSTPGSGGFVASTAARLLPGGAVSSGGSSSRCGPTPFTAPNEDVTTVEVDTAAGVDDIRSLGESMCQPELKNWRMGACQRRFRESPRQVLRGFTAVARRPVFGPFSLPC
jgi:hypothetical protein